MDTEWEGCQLSILNGSFNGIGKNGRTVKHYLSITFLQYIIVNGITFLFIGHTQYLLVMKRDYRGLKSVSDSVLSQAAE